MEMTNTMKRSDPSEETPVRTRPRSFDEYLREVEKGMGDWSIVADPPAIEMTHTASTSRLIDHGDRVEGATGSDVEIDGMLALAALKGWTKLRFEGPDDFVKRASAKALERGFDLYDQPVASSVPPAPDPLPSPETEDTTPDAEVPGTDADPHLD